MTIRPSDLPAAYREQALRAKSKELARGNDPVIATYYQTNDHEEWIRPVQVTRIMPTKLTIIQEPNGASEIVEKVSPGCAYHATYQEAWNAVEKRLREEVLTKLNRLNDFLNGQTSAEPARPA